MAPASPELQFLLACLRRGTAEASAPVLSAECLDWNRLLELARRHRLTSLLAWELEQSDLRLVPRNVQESLAAAFTRSAHRALQNSSELLNVMAALGAAGVDALAYKGPVLAAWLYGNPVLRPSADIDLLVSPTRLDQARDVLLERGYSPTVPFTPEQRALWLGAECSCDFVRQGQSVDLHWTIVAHHYAVDVSFASLWQRRRMARLGEEPIATLSPEDDLLALAIHGSKHLWERLVWVSDIARLLNREPLDWEYVQKRAAELHLRRILAISLRLAHDLLGASVPPDVWQTAERDRVARRISEGFISGYTTAAASSDLGRWQLQLVMRERRRDRARCALRYLTTAGIPEWDWIRLPRRAFWLYPAVRVARVGLNLLGISSLTQPQTEQRSAGA